MKSCIRARPASLKQCAHAVHVKGQLGWQAPHARGGMAMLVKRGSVSIPVLSAIIAAKVQNIARFTLGGFNFPARGDQAECPRTSADRVRLPLRNNFRKPMAKAIAAVEIVSRPWRLQRSLAR